ncbi:MAG TPA: S-methyl-5-thioribose-1-phosphate isomerase [Melioribacteraceae bacterium]|mgnify:CR=1 FL=1|nr:S-methyl-5-thioribose-1-phosphate isomerase [Melioribacteraceae bacterium]
MKNKEYFALKFENDKLIFLDQTSLPLSEDYICTDDYEVIAKAIEDLCIRGAPAIGIAAAYAISLAFKNNNVLDDDYFNLVFKRIESTRPTAVNLFYAINKIKQTYLQLSQSSDIYNSLLICAKKIHDEDIVKCEKIANNGLSIFSENSIVLTHCNTGKLATGGNGTALNIIINAYNNKLVKFVYVDETRPLMQGSRLTAFELKKNEIPFAINVDSAAAFLMQQKKIDLAIVGADRIAKNGDTANKIGSYNLAVNCRYHNIPFFVAAPVSTIDFNCSSGKDIPIEERSKFEISRICNIKFTKSTYPIYNPAFDIIPAELISGIITDNGIFTYPFDLNV